MCDLDSRASALSRGHCGIERHGGDRSVRRHADRCLHRRLRSRRNQLGLTLIEVMVGLVISLMITAAAIGSSRYVSGHQRAALDINSAGGNETNALAALKFEVAQAGLGFFAEGRLLCRTINLSKGTTPIAAAGALMPLQLGADAGGLMLDVLHGSAVESVSPAQLAGPVNVGDTSVAIASFLPLTVGQTLLLVPGPASGAPCTVRTATAVSPSSGLARLTVRIDPSGDANQVSFADASYAASDFVSQLGQLQWSRFRLENGSLLMERPLDGGRAVMARNVVAFAAEYGTADAGGVSIAAWRAPVGDWATLDPTRLAALRAVRLVLVLRSAQPEKKDAGGHCTATPTLPVVLGTPLATADPDWACYRYRVGAMVVPLRNIVMGSGR